jgi:hypothetical protein
MSDVFAHTRRAARSSLRCIASKIVQRSTRAFADYINGQRVGDGVNSIMLMLESKNENLNRREGSLLNGQRGRKEQTRPQTEALTTCMGHSTSIEKTGRRKSKSKQFEHYGCLSWQPAMPEGDNDELHDRMRLELLPLLETNGDPCKVKDLMKTTYSSQRRVINLGMPNAQIFEQWPLLHEPEY